MAGTDIAIACRCGEFGAVLKHASPKTGSHVQCYCKDCQAGAKALGAEDTLMPRGGTDIFQTLPASVEITKGEAHLAALRLSPRGLIRWYASCCDTPVFNTLGTQKLSFVGLFVNTMQGDAVDKTVGKVIAVNSAETAAPGVGVLKSYGFNKAGFHVLARHFGAMLRGDAKTGPFFDAEGAPTVTPRVLTKDERRVATP
ncbi:DUF6151 family protein [Shimia haliotis]|uniref:CENP-V/GFA domain-containing protein n=1 Tax=Shimia haliotis TaxID=1280847 RepID=A0A1I4AAI8_9RHOB|nr:DUF6151 family protein [Shimia haliotis]SFK52816.1 hypothetical protein SAMN04488036_101227 [Shimia haliotis]